MEPLQDRLLSFGNSSYGTVQSSLVPRSNDPDSASLPAPKPFFGHHITFGRVVNAHLLSLNSLEEAQEIRSTEPSYHSNPPQRIRDLEGRAHAYSILAQEAAEEFSSQSAERLSESEQSEEFHDPTTASLSDESRRSEETLLPAQLPDSFFSTTTSSFYKMQRKQRKQLAIAAVHDEKALRYLREARYKKKFCALLKEHHQFERAEQEAKMIEHLEERASYHSLMAQQIQMRLYGDDSNMLGAHHVVAEGNYELELPLKPPSPVQKAQKIKNPGEDLIRLAKTKAVPIVSAKKLKNEYPFSGLDSKKIRPSSELPRSSEEGQFLREKLAREEPEKLAREEPEKLASEVNGYKNKKLLLKQQQQLPVAQKINLQEVIAVSPRNLKLPEARASRSANFS